MLRAPTRDIHCKNVRWSNGIWARCSDATVAQTSQCLRSWYYALSSIASFLLDTLWGRSQNYNGRDATPKRSVFHPTYCPGPILASRTAAPIHVGRKEVFKVRPQSRQIAEKRAMRSPVEYFSFYQSLAIPYPDGSADLASGISVDHYRLGAQQPYIDERLRLDKKVQKGLQLRKKEHPEATIHVRVASADGYEEHDDQRWALVRYPLWAKDHPKPCRSHSSWPQTKCPEARPSSRQTISRVIATGTSCATNGPGSLGTTSPRRKVAGVIRVYRWLNGSTLNVRVKGAPGRSEPPQAISSIEREKDNGDELRRLHQ
jgi:hypothetical protein